MINNINLSLVDNSSALPEKINIEIKSDYMVMENDNTPLTRIKIEDKTIDTSIQFTLDKEQMEMLIKCLQMKLL